ncbi:alanine racemase [Microbacterium sp. H1-D42]|uniref:alanine racemase n=1 Tax=Microbacterium sp. H1-D42 TaxID=2925844 RepID=UPI001F53CDAC|nr:alanine racemase [Microbacterium sp. H1-D42]UNK71126.1 alanine racemase [Microbacterium sp. H1-D42]
MIESSPLSLTKGLGPALDDAGTTDLAGTSLFASDRDFPQLALSESAILHNIDAMMAYVRSRGVALAPHGKTAMSPKLAQWQVDAGAWGITAATPTQLRVYRAAGIEHLLLANQLVEPGAIAWLRAELAADPHFVCPVYADSAAGLALLAEPASATTSAPPAAGARPIDVLLEVGHPGGRTGVRGLDALRELAAQAAHAPGIRVIGLATYEGTLGGETEGEKVQKVHAFVRELAASASTLEAEGLLPADSIISLGGSAYFDVAVDELLAAGIPAARILLRSGAYLTHDDGLYARTTPGARGSDGAPDLLSAIRVWAPVLSIPEPGLAVALCGRRDVGFDQDLPSVRGVRGVRGRDGSAARGFVGRVAKLADQHAFIEFDADAAGAGAPPRVGDLVELGISHPCTTLDRWGLVPLVDDELRVRDLIRLHFT